MYINYRLSVLRNYESLSVTMYDLYCKLYTAIHVRTYSVRRTLYVLPYTYSVCCTSYSVCCSRYLKYTVKVFANFKILLSLMQSTHAKSELAAHTLLNTPLSLNYTPEHNSNVALPPK